MGSDSRPVCHRCAQIKQACDGSLPCARCVRLGLPCRPRDSSGSAAAAAAAAIAGFGAGHAGDVPKARIRRVQTGCLMCKRRKKKCDETKPRCGDCRRLCLDCAWPPERHKDKAAMAAAAHAADSNLDGQVNGTVNVATNGNPVGEMDALAADIDNKNFVTDGKGFITDVVTKDISIRNSPSPRSSASQSGSFSGSLPGSHSGSIQGNHSHGQVHIVQQHQHQHMHSHTHSHSHHQADHSPNMPTTTMMATTTMATSLPTSAISDFEMDINGDPLSWDLTQSSSSWLDGITPGSQGSPESLDSAGSMSSLSIYIPQLLPQLSTPQDKALLNHYSTIVSSILSRRSSTTNPYNSYLLPMAQGNDLVLHCILALSANHWRKLQPSMGDRGLLHQHKATQALARVLPHVDKTSADVALVSSLLLCMTELFDGTSEGWKLHLKGAKRLLTTLRNQQGEAMTGHYKFLLRLARFLDSAATTSTCRPPLIGEEEVEARNLDRLAASPDEEDSAVYGIPKELFHLVDRVNSLADLRKTRVDRASEAKFREEAAHVEERINHWSYEYGGLSRAVWTLTPANDDVLYATIAFEYAIRLRLHQIIEGYELTDPKVSQSVEGILDSVQKIRYGSPLEVCLLFPLVMAGGACFKLEHRVVIQDRLMVMERTCGFGYIYNARDLVERVWARRDEAEGTGAIVNWARIRFEEMNGLVVF